MTTPCVMLLSAVASNRLLASSRRSVKAPTRLIPSTAMAALATAIASVPGESEKAVMARVGSGTISTAPMAVK